MLLLLALVLLQNPLKLDEFTCGRMKSLSVQSPLCCSPNLTHVVSLTRLASISFTTATVTMTRVTS